MRSDDRVGKGGRGGGESVDQAAVVPFISADEESLVGRAAPSFSSYNPCTSDLPLYS